MNDWKLHLARTLTCEEWAEANLTFVRHGPTEPGNLRDGTTREGLDEEIRITRERILFLIGDDLERLAVLNALCSLCRTDHAQEGD